jgi:hypothetical protein
MNREAVLQLLHNRDQHTFDVNHTGSIIGMASDGDWLVGEPKEEVVTLLTKHAEGQLFGRIKIPTSYARRCPPSLRCENVNHWLSTMPSKEFMFRHVINPDTTSYVRAVVSGRYTPMDDHQVIPVILDELQIEGDFDVAMLSQHDDITLMDVSFTDLEADMDAIRTVAGVSVINSEIGMSSLCVRPRLRYSTASGAAYTVTDSSEEGVTRIRHIGEFSAERVRGAIQKAVEVASVGAAQLFMKQMEVSQEPWEEMSTVVQTSATIPMRLLTVLEDEWQHVERASKLAIATALLEAVQELPPFKRHLATSSVGRYLSLFERTSERLTMVAERQV